MLPLQAKQQKAMKIIPIELKGSDERGYTAEYEHSRKGQQLIVFRKAGSISGRHYHKGMSATKDPELFLLLNGTCIINWRHIDDAELQTATVTGPTRLEIPSMIWHEVVAKTDCTFIEMNSIEEHATDTFFLD